jgi:hypothetical protein
MKTDPRFSVLSRNYSHMSLSKKLIPLVLVATTVFAVSRWRRKQLEPEHPKQGSK